MLNRIYAFIMGEPLSPVDRNYDARLPKWKALAVHSADALSSTAYATEEMLIPLIAFSALASYWSGPLTLAIVGLIMVVLLACRRSIRHFPKGGATYTVAKEELGPTAGLFTAAALLIDTVLTVAVSVAASANNLVSAFSVLNPFPIAIALLLIAFVMWINLRGVRQISLFFALPVYGFLFLISAMIIVGLWRMGT
ncbi:MAG: amino acid permease, partial [Bdellovibrionota bacterium]